ncbi:HAMP domain-containing sensor histidine kinase [Pseudoflavonifractor sp. 524-17]|uniref:sensor histidine kinase n=1 Tax=Pseudoflavonifractor sp. 524-17 TaxID=2304577 RepID=UPI001FAD62B0|nr:HAMP domain-containing sensor histidine kinase [Pseudoflavonifractor sp. 524-17]
MAKQKNDSSNPQKPLSRLKSSIVTRLNTKLFFRLLRIYVGMDLLLALLALGGILVWAEYQCADIAALVEWRGVPSAEATVWMQAGDYTVAALDRAPRGTGAFSRFSPSERLYTARRTLCLGGHILFGDRQAAQEPDVAWSVLDTEHTFDLVTFLEEGAVSYGWVEQPVTEDAPLLDSPRAERQNHTLYIVELTTSGGAPYAIWLNIHWPVSLFLLALRILMICQLLSLVCNLFKNAGTIRKTLKPIQELAAAANRLGHPGTMSPEELRALAGKLDEINATHLDTRISVPGTQKELQTLAQAINAMLDRINEAYHSQMRFVSDASHELRTPIAVIQGYANLLNRWGKDDPATRQEAIDAIQGEAGAMKELVEQLLFLARGDNDSMHIEMELFDLTEMAAEVLRETEMIDRTHVFAAQWEGAVPIRADVGLTKQALRILVDNAIKYTPADGRITLSVKSEGNSARLTVQDEGQGIDAASLPHIFDRFYRTDESRTRQTGGTGLGLAIARWIVERHGGWFEVTSWEGVGTRMAVVFPLDCPAGADLPEDAAPPRSA